MCFSSHYIFINIIIPGALIKIIQMHEFLDPIFFYHTNYVLFTLFYLISLPTYTFC